MYTLVYLKQFQGKDIIVHNRKFYSPLQSSKDCPLHAVLLSGALAGNVFWLITYPFDVVKSKIQGDSFENPKYKGMIDCFKYQIL